MNTESDIKLVEILSGHYSETFDQLKEVVARRDRLFLYILLVIFILLLYVSSPTIMSEWVNSFFSNQVTGATGATMQPLINVSVVGVVLLLALLSFSHTYFQTVLHIERQYNYVYQLEEQLGKFFNDKAFIREGKHYRNHKRTFSAWTKFIFWYLFPILYLLFILYFLWFLFTSSQIPAGFKIIDSLIAVSIVISMWFYLLAIIKKK